MKSIVSKNYQRVIETLISARKSKGVRQIAVAEALGKPQSYVSKIEGKERRLDVVEFVDLCRAIGVSPTEIMRQSGLIAEDE